MNMSSVKSTRPRPAPLEARAQTSVKKQKPDSRLLTGPASNGMRKRTYKKAVVFCNGDLADLSRVRRHINTKTLLVGCDGGTSHILALGLVPHVVIGDFDSISSKTQRALSTGGKGKEVEYFRYPTDKLYTDSELGLALAMERGCKEIILAGVRGTATDHFLGNLFLLAKKKLLNV